MVGDRKAMTGKERPCMLEFVGLCLVTQKSKQGACFIKKEGFHFLMSESVQFLQGGFVKILDYSGENVYMVYIERVCSIFIVGRFGVF